MQLKALEMLSKGGKVLILTPACFAQKYDAFFKKHGFKSEENYKIQTWSFELTNEFDREGKSTFCS